MRWLIVCIWWCAWALILPGQDVMDFESPPINYSQAKADNPLEKLATRVNQKKVILPHSPEQGHLRGLLAELAIPESSQILVFAKTSLQGHHIGPKTPRAIYFNDDTVLGYVQGEEGLLEIVTTDANLGVSFYTISQKQGESPFIQRETNRCMSCHGGTRSKGVPGLMVRSVIVDPQGKPVLSAGNFRSDHSSPISQRWGGWYVTGNSGDQKHLGNFTLDGPKKTKPLDNDKGQNVTELSPWIDTKPYLQPHSDMVSLMVLEHQADVVNYLTRLGFENKITRNPDSPKLDVPVDDLVRQLLFSKETRLTAPVRGTSQFVRDFEANGPRDKKGRSLREFDLQTRMFRYPLSYMVYSRAFANLPRDLRNRVLVRIHKVLTTPSPEPGFEHLKPLDRTALIEIVRDTVPNLPHCWNSRG